MALLEFPIPVFIQLKEIICDVFICHKKYHEKDLVKNEKKRRRGTTLVSVRNSFFKYLKSSE